MADFLELTVSTTHEASELICDILWDYSEGGVAVNDVADVIDLMRSGKTWDYADEGIFKADKTVLIKAYLPLGKESAVSEIEKRFLKLKNSAPFDVGSLETVKRKVDGDLWKEQWKEHFKPIYIKNAVIVPEWVNYEVKDGEIPVYIGSNMAFGTGEHETTSMCVEFLQKYVKSGVTVADVGSGSGILGITAAKLGAKEVLLTDIDECAVEASLYNLKLNGVKNATMQLKNLLDDNEIKVDLIVANIMAEVLISFAPDIGKNLKEKGVIILSGILKDRKNKVISAYRNHGFDFKEGKTVGEWSAVVMEKL